MPSLYGIGAYGTGQYSRMPLVDIAGDLAPSICFAGNLGVVVDLAGDLRPMVEFGPSLLTTPQNIDGDLSFTVMFAGDMSLIYAVNGDIAPQTVLSGSLTGDWILAGDLAPKVVFAADAFLGPLWQEAAICPPPVWQETELCPPPLWTPTIPPNFDPSGATSSLGYGMRAYGVGVYNDVFTPWIPADPVPPVSWGPSPPSEDVDWNETELCDG